MLLKLRIATVDGRRILLHNAYPMRFIGPPQALDALEDGREFEVDCGYTTEQELVALSLVGAGERPAVEGIGALLDAGDVRGAHLHLLALQAAKVRFNSELLTLLVRCEAARRRAGDADADVAAAFHLLLDSMKFDWGKIKNAVDAFESFDDETKEAQGPAFVAWVDKRRDALPPELRSLSFLPRSLLSHEALLQSATYVLSGLSTRTATDKDQAQQELQSALDELTSRTLPAPLEKRRTRLVEEAEAILVSIREESRRRELGDIGTGSTLKTVERIFGVPLPPSLREAWSAAMGRQGRLRYYDVVSQGTHQVLSAGDALSHALGRSGFGAGPLLALPFAYRGSLGDKWIVYALDLRAAPNDGDYPVLEWLQNRGVDRHDAEREQPRVVADSARGWLSASVPSHPARGSSPLEPPDALSREEKARFEHLRAAIKQRGLPFFSPMTAQELDHFEQDAGARLPAQLRAFLTTIGNGGDRGSSPSQSGLWELLETPGLAEPFLLTRAVVTDRAGKGAQGRLCVGSDGCAQFHYLVITGGGRGQMWESCDEGYAPMKAGKRRLDFFGWYEKWLRSS